MRHLVFTGDLLKRKGLTHPRMITIVNLINGLRADFPNKFEAPKKRTQARVASADSSSSRSTKKGRRTVKLTDSQVAIAKKLGVPLEEYAKYVKE